MKKLLEMELLLEDSINIAKSSTFKSQSHKPIESNFINTFLNFFDEYVESLNKEKIIILKEQLDQMDIRNKYTITKAILDKISIDIFKQVPSNYQVPYIYAKIFKENNPLSIEFDTSKLNKTQLAYIFISASPLAFLKLPRSSQMIDSLTGETHLVKEYFQVNKMSTLQAVIAEDLKVSVQCPYTLGIVILNKKK